MAQTINERGLLLDIERERVVISPAAGMTLRAAGSIAAAVNEASAPFDLAIFTVKSYDTESALSELSAALAQRDQQIPSLLSLQNGVGNEELLARVAGSSRIIAGTITTPVSFIEPGLYRIEKNNTTVGLSAWHPAVPKALMQQLHRALSNAGFDCVLYKRAESMKWTKLLMNSFANASSAILDLPPRVLITEPLLLDIEIEAWREALAVMRRASIEPVAIGRYPFGLLAAPLRHLPKRLLRPMLRRLSSGARGAKMPSLHIDLHGGKGKSEVRWLNGAVVERGRALGVPTPVNNVLTETLLELVEFPAKRELWRGNSLRLAAAVAERRDLVHSK